jgi:ketosteroid isomerase-like protein
VTAAVTSPLDRYFRAIDAGDVEATTAAFADDALYIRPSLEVPGTLETIRGRHELRAFFTRRGQLPFRHEVRAVAVDGNDCFVEGAAYVEDRPTNTFLAHVTLDDDGLIKRYFALMASSVDE